MAEFPGGSILGPIGNVVGAIAGLIGSFIGITAARLLEFLKLLKDYVLQLSKELLIGVFRTARAIARLARTVATLAAHGVKEFALWSAFKLKYIYEFLKDELTGVLKWLEELKQHIRDIYDRFVRPIVDVIQFIRQLNALLALFHVDLLKKLDAVLAKVEQRIEDPFIKLNQWITWAENQIDRIITLDGFIQRFTLLKSMAKYAAPWTNGFWNSQIDPTKKAGTDYSRTRTFPHIEPQVPAEELGAFYRGEGTPFGADMSELVSVFRQSAGLDAPAPS